jgi:hypothetical protein
MVRIHRIFKNQNVADICEKKDFYIKSAYILSSFCLGCIYYYYFFFRVTRIFFFSFCLSFKYPFCALLDFLFMYSCFLLFCSLFFLCSYYLDDVAQFHSKGLISSSLSSFPTIIIDHVLFFLFLSFFQNKQL